MSLIHTSPLARLPLHVTAGTTALVVNVLATFVGGGTTGDCGVGVYIDGVYSQELVPVANGITQYTVALDGSAHDVTLVNSYINFAVGSFVYSYSATGGTASVRTVAVPATKYVLYGDSILTGALAVPLTRDSWAARLQNLLPEGAVSLEAFGGRAVWDDAGSGAGQTGLFSLSALTTRFLYHLRGATTKYAVMQIGVNDALFSGAGRWSAASYGTALGTLLDDIHAADASIHVYLFSPLITGIEGSVNGFGNTVVDYRSQCSTVAGTRTGFVTFTAGTSLMVAGGLSGDNLHPTTNGHASIWDGTGGFAGTTTMRAVLGV